MQTDQAKISLMEAHHVKDCIDMYQPSNNYDELGTDQLLSIVTKRKSSVATVATVGGKPVGFHVFLVNKTAIYGFRTWVNEEYRNRGLGSNLIAWQHDHYPRKRHVYILKDNVDPPVIFQHKQDFLRTAGYRLNKVIPPSTIEDNIYPRQFVYAKAKK